MNIKAIVSDKKYPSFISKHKVFTQHPKINKVFPALGLKNCTGKVKDYLDKIDCSLELDQIKKNMRKAIQCCEGFPNNYRWEYNDNYSIGRQVYPSAKDKAAIATYKRTLRELLPQLTIKASVKDGKLILPCKLTSFKQGTSLIPALTSLQSAAQRIFARNRHWAYVNHDLIRLPKKPQSFNNCDIVFSADGKEGIWDMATMSMRGISSCQSWGGSFRRRLIGSIIDPCCGIIYLTDNKQSARRKGSKMLARALVRYIKKGRKSALMLKRVYPTAWSNDNYRYEAKYPHLQFLFAAFLQDKTNIKCLTSGFKAFKVPLTKPVKSLSDTDRSYRDSHIGYSAALMRVKNVS